jgi:hypothetical protein
MLSVRLQLRLRFSSRRIAALRASASFTLVIGPVICKQKELPMKNQRVELFYAFGFFVKKIKTLI